MLNLEYLTYRPLRQIVDANDATQVDPPCRRLWPCDRASSLCRTSPSSEIIC